MNRVVYHVSNTCLFKRHFTHDVKNAVGTLVVYHVSNASLFNRQLLYDKFATVYVFTM